MNQPRSLPHSEELEAAVLSAWLLHDRFGLAWTPEPDLFHVPAHRAIAQGLAALEKHSRDQAGLLAQLEQTGALERAGGAGNVYRVITGAPAYGDPWPHVQKLRELRALRDAMRAIEAAVSEAYEHKTLAAFVARMQDSVRLASSESGTAVFTVADVVRACAKAMMEQRDPKRVSTGLPTLDQHTGGYQHKQVAILGAGTNWGKSSYAVMETDVAFNAGQRPLLVSFEDPEELYGRRLTARRAQVSPNLMRDNRYKPTDEEWHRVLMTAQRAEQLPFFVNGIGRTVERVATDIRCVCAAEAIDIVIVDYLQAIQCSKRCQDRRNEVTYIARTLTDAIKGSGTAGVMFSQFKRKLEAGDVPTMQDLKESGDLENAAEMVLVGFLDKDGNHVLSVEKCKDGVKGGKYGLGWSAKWCGFTGELEGYVYPDRSSANNHRGHR